MTEESFQQCRKIMQKANYMRGMITTQKGHVAKWTRMQHANIENMQPEQAAGCEKMLQLYIKKLKEARENFEMLSFPDSNIVKIITESAQCEVCGNKVAKGNSFCGECLCED